MHVERHDDYEDAPVFADVGEAVELATQRSATSLVSGRVQADFFDEALHTVDVLGEVNSALQAASEPQMRATTYAEEALLGRVEDQQGFFSPVVRGDSSASSVYPEELAGRMAVVAGPDGELMARGRELGGGGGGGGGGSGGGEAGGATADGGMDGAVSDAAAAADAADADADAAADATDAAAAADGGAPLTARDLARASAAARADQMRPLLPSATAVGAAAAKTVRGSASPAGPRGPGARARCAMCARAAARAAGAAAQRAAREVALLACLMLPHVLAVYGHGDVGAWELWLLRPLYALAAARVLAALVFALASAPRVTDATPAQFTLVVNAYGGWPAIILVWMLLSYFGGALRRAPDWAAWTALDAQFDYLFGVRIWLFAIAASRGLLELYLCGMFSRLQSSHFTERISSALLALKVFRLLFAASRASVRRARARRAQGWHPTAAPGGAPGTPGRGGGGAGRYEHGGGGGKLSSSRQPAQPPDPSDGPTSPAARLDAQLFGAASADGARDGRGDGGGNGGGEMEMEMDDGLALLRDAMQNGSGFVSSLAQARHIGAQSFRALHAELARVAPELQHVPSQSQLSAQLSAPPPAPPPPPSQPPANVGGVAQPQPPSAVAPGGTTGVTTGVTALPPSAPSASPALPVIVGALKGVPPPIPEGDEGGGGASCDGAPGAAATAAKPGVNGVGGGLAGGGGGGGGGGGVCGGLSAGGSSVGARSTAPHAPALPMQASRTNVGAQQPAVIPREWLLRVVASAASAQGARVRGALCAKMLQLFQTESVTEADYVAATERAYKEQRFIGASVDSYDSLHAHVNSFIVASWAVVCGIAGVFLVDWGVDLQQWVMPFSSTVLSAALVCGWLPYETISGILYVLVVRPYDIGDRIMIIDPGRPSGGTEGLIVSEIHLTSTRVIHWNGEQQTIMNHITRRLVVINMNRSGPCLITHRIELPAHVPGAKISEIVDAVRVYVEARSQDWVGVASANLESTQYSRGLVVLEIYVKSAHKRCDEGPIYAAKTSLLLFVHSYLQAAGIEFARPVQPVRHIFGANGGIDAAALRALGVTACASKAGSVYGG